MPRSDWAAWVQAVGSILALVVAVGVPYWQAWHTRRLQRTSSWQSELDAIKAIEFVVEVALARLRLAVDVIVDGDAYDDGAYQHAVGALRDLPDSAAPTAPLLLALRKAKNAVASANQYRGDMWQAIACRPPDHPEKIARLRKLFDECVSEAAEAVQVIATRRGELVKLLGID